MRAMIGAAVLAVGLGLAGTAGAQPRPAQAQGFPPDPLGQAAAAAQPVDPDAWWSAPEQPNELIDPLGNRRAPRGAVSIPAPVDASVYRLWGLMPLQTQVLRRDETVYEVWVRPVDASRQAVVRVTLRTDNRAFVQARAGRGCCGPGVTRRVDIDRELDRDSRDRLRALKADALWTQPQHVLVQEEGAVAGLCVEGTAYDLMRVEARRTVHLRRSCDPAEVGSVAPALRAILTAATGVDPRFDAALKGGTGFAKEAEEHAALLARGGRLRPKRALSASVSDDPAPVPVAPDAPESEPADDDPRAEVLAADRAFAARAQQVGAAQAFREFADPDDAKMWPTGGEPVVGAEAVYAFMGGDAPASGRLLWEPAEAVVAESGEIAVTWGRSRQIPNDGTRPERVGRYVTLWRKDEDGRWRFLWDLGNSRALEPGEAPPPGP